MKKFSLIILSFFACSLKATEEMQFDQFYLTISQYSYVNYKAMEMCKENNYKYFKFVKIVSKDSVGGIIDIKNNSENINADILRNELTEQEVPFGPWDCEFEIACYKEKPNDEIIMDVDAFWEKADQAKVFAATMEKDTSIKEITSLQELEEEISKDRLVLVDCYSSYCNPCQKLYPIFKQYSEEYSDKASFLKVNLSNAEDVAKAYNVKAAPTLLIFDNNKFQDRKIGLPEISKYLESITE